MNTNANTKTNTNTNTNKNISGMSEIRELTDDELNAVSGGYQLGGSHGAFAGKVSSAFSFGASNPA